MTKQNASLALLMICLGYTAFIIYGSLVPLDFVPLPLNEALEKFRNTPYLDLGIGSRADWVANILLFIPLTFMWSAFFHQGANNFRYFTALIILIIAMALCISIEFTQLFFPQRTVSKNDIVAEIAGGFVGLILWRAYGQHFNNWFRRWRMNREASGRYEQLLYIYLAILFGYNLLPLDLTNSPVEIYHKWVDGKVHIIPFFASFDDGLVSFLYSIFVDIIIWVPVPLLWIFSAKKNLVQAIKWSWLSAFLLEFLQLFVYSRVSDSADLITAALGTALGALIAVQLRPANQGRVAAGNLASGYTTPASLTSKDTHKNFKGLTTSLVLIAAWSVTLLLIFWFPYDFRTEPEFIKQRLPLIYGAPFSAYYYGTEFRALTSLLSKLAFFFPLGVLLAHLKTTLSRSWPDKLITIIVVGFLLAISSIVEFGQIALPDKSIDSADILVALLGSLSGYFAYLYVNKGQSILQTTSSATGHKQRPTQKTLSTQQYSPPLATTRLQSETATPIIYAGSRRLLPLQWLIVVLAFYLIENISAVPYNVKELITTSNLFERMIFSLALLSAVWPVLYASRAYFSDLLARKWYSTTLVIQPFILYGLLRLSVPLESIHDIVGYPVLSTVWEWESLLRFVSLYSLPSWALVGATILLFHSTASRILGWLLIGIIVTTAWHWVVIRLAATDNLTELLRDGGNWQSSLWLSSWFISFSIALLTALKLISGKSKHWLMSLIAIAASFPLGYWILNQSLEVVIMKYGQIFSGLQFLLSPDREHLIPSNNLLLIYFLAHAAFLSGAVWLGITAITTNRSSFSSGARSHQTPKDRAQDQVVSR